MIRLGHVLTALGLCVPLSTGCGDDDDDGGAAETTGVGTGTETTGVEPTAPTGPTIATTTTPTTTTETTGAATTGVETTGATTGGTGTGTTTGGPADMAEIRFVQLAVNTPPLDVFADGDGPVVEEVASRQGTEYLMIPAGEHVFEMSVSGTGADEALLAPALTLEAATRYTAVAIGDQDMTDGAPGLQAISLVDDDEGIAGTDIRITVVHAAPVLGQFDVYELTDPENPVVLVEDVDFGGSATLDDIPAGALEIGLDTDDDAVSDITFSIPDAGLGGSQVNTYASSDADGNVDLVAQLPDGSVLPLPAN